jgi:hypothetical protein
MMKEPTKLERAVAWYAENAYARATVSGIGSLVPFAGAAVDAFLGTMGTELAERRRDALFAELRAILSRLDESKVDKDYFRSEEWADLLLKAIYSSAQTRDAEKIKLFAAILAGAATQERPIDLDVEAVLGTLANLTPVEITIAGKMYEAVEADPTVFVDGLPTPPVDADAEFHMKRLEAAGLVAARQPNGMTFQHMVTYHLTPTFYRIIAMLRGVGYAPTTDQSESDDNHEATPGE